MKRVKNTRRHTLEFLRDVYPSYNLTDTEDSVKDIIDLSEDFVIFLVYPGKEYDDRAWGIEHGPMYKPGDDKRIKEAVAPLVKITKELYGESGVIKP